MTDAATRALQADNVLFMMALRTYAAKHGVAVLMTVAHPTNEVTQQTVVFGEEVGAPSQSQLHAMLTSIARHYVCPDCQRPILQLVEHDHD